MTKQERRQRAAEEARVNAEFAKELRKALGWDRGNIEDYRKAKTGE